MWNVASELRIAPPAAKVTQSTNVKSKEEIING
jgi:hypothetical protein